MKVNIHDAKTHFSTYIAKLQASGETIIICNRNEPVAELRAIQKQKRVPRIGVAKGEYTVPESFFDPLPDDILKAFNGE